MIPLEDVIEVVSYNLSYHISVNKTLEYLAIKDQTIIDEIYRIFEKSLKLYM
tara:strand:+ start:5063 stop:5218 length:156 start_codon:yes stop_codon:yes gene_type:complete